jgi:hypothetical protein
MCAVNLLEWMLIKKQSQSLSGNMSTWCVQLWFNVALQGFDQILHDTAVVSGARPDNRSEVICKNNLEQFSFLSVL